MKKTNSYIALKYKQGTQGASPMHSKGFSRIAGRLLKDSLNFSVPHCKDGNLMGKIYYLNILEGIPSNIKTILSNNADFTFRKDAAFIIPKTSEGGLYA
ncbi:MAG: hypothetical protein GX121_10675 [Ignavibacteria bacterium]|nr:hypothetical protein [Ignavibacteria bacterium]